MDRREEISDILQIANIPIVSYRQAVEAIESLIRNAEDEAIEKCAKVVNNLSDSKVTVAIMGMNVPKSIHSSNIKEFVLSIAEAIRQLKSEGGE